MRTTYSAIGSGTGRTVALACAACVSVLLVLAVALVARNDHARADADLRRHVVGASRQVAQSISNRLDAAEAVLRTTTDTLGSQSGPTLPWQHRLEQSGLFSSQQVLVPDADGQLAGMRRQLQLTAQQRFDLQNGFTAAVVGESPSGLQVFLVRRIPPAAANRMLVVELAQGWLWGALDWPDGALQVLAVDAGGRRLAGMLDGTEADVRSLFASRIASPPGREELLSWQGGGVERAGLVRPVPVSSRFSAQPLAIVAAGVPQGWVASVRHAAIRLLPALVAALLLVLLAAVVAARRSARLLRTLRRALSQLGEPNATFPRPSAAFPEWREVAAGFNRAARQVDEQRRMLRTLVDIDELLIGTAEVEHVLDRVLVRMRELMRSRNVSLLLLDSSVPDHGRLFSVRMKPALSISRVGLDPSMAQTLLESHAGLTIMRCEEERHSFLLPLRDAGTEFFWVWPIVTSQRLVAVLAVGYVDPPAQGAQIVQYGTECARRLAAALATSTRSEELYRQAHFDPLTQLPNRLLFRDRLEQELYGQGGVVTRGALLYIDLDHFKRVNDSMGHDAGDQLLAVVAQRLRACVKEGDTVARLAGDEFTVILRQIGGPEVAAAAAERIIESLQMPVGIGGKDHVVRASIGITLFPDDAATPEELMRNADLAMYQAKAQGRSAAVFYEPQLAQRLMRVADSGLFRALKRHEFSLLFQPQFSVRDGSLQGVEALLRWQSPRDGLRTPGEFIAAAEESGLIIDLGGWVLEAACQQVARWSLDGLVVPRVAVNVSVQQLRDPGFAGSLQRLLDRYQIPDGTLELELTEAVLIDPEAQESVEALSAMGVGLILDDFGTGHAALNNLRRHPVRVVKIDRSFVEQLDGDAAAMALVDTLIVMARGVGKQVVAEGVETMEQLDFLRERGCDIVQGFYLARPMTAALMTDLLVRAAGRDDDAQQVARA